MILYLTYGDQPSGIYKGQVIDVVQLIEVELKQKIKLIAIISGRNFFSNRKIIKKELPGAIVIPMFPQLQNWRKNRFLLYLICAFARPRLIIARSVLATNLALLMRNRRLTKEVVFDGRGAISPEWNEYDVVQNGSMKRTIFQWEKNAVLLSDRQIAVSKKLIAWWQRKFGFSKDSAVVIPCTVNRSFENVPIAPEAINSVRLSLKVGNDAIMLVYSGSIAGWQSFSLLSGFLEKIMENDKRIVLLFLSGCTPEIEELEKRFHGRVFQKRVKPEEVPYYLIGCDYGLMIREQNTVNEVASPVKFAEYLACGLNVIISDGLGDYSEFVRNNQCGFVWSTVDFVLKQISPEERKRNRQLALSHFLKQNYLKEYSDICNRTGL